MTGSAILGVALGALATAAYALVVALTFAYSAAIAADSATTTAGIIQVAEPRSKGTTMSLYAIIGFTGAFVGPVIFGTALDLAGGDQMARAWLAAFGAIALHGPARAPDRALPDRQRRSAGADRALRPPAPRGSAQLFAADAAWPMRTGCGRPGLSAACASTGAGPFRASSRPRERACAW